ncbi:hypothetical protein Gotri_022265, partial [Gossypium trilobum]|nr:hypothetical protein [Gossypium trilobum]
MKTHDINFANRPFLLGAEIVLYNLSDIAFAPYGSCWRQLRKVCTWELLKMLCNLSYNITLRTAFAGRCKKHEAFISFLKKFGEAMAGFNIADLFPSIKFLPDLSGMRAELERFHHDIDTMLESIIQEHRDSSANPEDSVDVSEDLVDVLLNLQDHGGLEFPLTINNIKAVILDILMGGTETSSTLAEWAMSEMMKNPRILGKAQAEVRELYDKTGDVNESNLHELKYLKL